MTRNDHWKTIFNSLATPASQASLSRRRFVQSALAASAVAGASPMLGSRAAAAQSNSDQILVAVMFGGGNDGFDMTIPAEQSAYQKSRKSLAIDPGDAIWFEDGLYWHPALTDIADRYQAGDIAVVQGVGEVEDDRSHFSSMARWMSGHANGTAPGFTGWLGRWLDDAGAGELGAIHIGDSAVPLHMKGYTAGVLALPLFSDLLGANPEAWERPLFNGLKAIGASGAPGLSKWQGEVAGEFRNAVTFAKEVEPAYGQDLPENEIVRLFAICAQAINLDLGTRVFSLGFGDFDTHDDHRPRHDELMKDFNRGVKVFYERLDQKHHDKVALMTFSEFGRSWTANDSAGVDHGTVSNSLVIGKGVAGGLYGRQPRFNVRDYDGDLEHSVDFRSVYGSVIDGWLGGGSSDVLGGNYENLGLFGGPASGPPKCDGIAATIVGTPGDDVLKGTSGRDVIVGLGGNDTINGLDGNDVICGGAGKDTVNAGGGGDVVFGGGGRDRLKGQSGKDLLFGQGGNDSLIGGGGKDLLNGGKGKDKQKQ